MSTIDLFFLAVGTAVLAALLLFDKLSRAIVWEALRHPFTHSRIDVKDGNVRVSRFTSSTVQPQDHPSGVP